MRVCHNTWLVALALETDRPVCVLSSLFQVPHPHVSLSPEKIVFSPILLQLSYV